MPRINVSDENYKILNDIKQTCNQYVRQGKYTMDDVLTDVLRGKLNEAEVGVMGHTPQHKRTRKCTAGRLAYN